MSSSTLASKYSLKVYKQGAEFTASFKCEDGRYFGASGATEGEAIKRATTALLTLRDAPPLPTDK